MNTDIETGIKKLRALLEKHRFESVGHMRNYDFEAVHSEADDIILEYLPDEIKKTYLEVEEKCGGFVCA